MKRVILFLFCWPFATRAQLIFDQGHFAAVNQNGGAREAAETAHEGYLSEVHDRLSDIEVNLSAVALVQRMIEGSLREVNGALKSGMMAKQVVEISGEIANECDQMIATARSDPLLFLFAKDVSSQLKDRGVKLVTEVSGFVLEDSGSVLMDFDKRDALLRKIVLELKVMRALTYSMNRSMYWARQNGLWKMANPFAGYVSQDARMIHDILSNSYLLK